MDQTLFIWINSKMAGPLLDRLMAPFSASLLPWVPWLLLVIVGVMIFGCFKSRAMVVVALVTVGLCDGVVVYGIKKAVGRLRPNQVETVRRVELQRTEPRFLAIWKQPTVRLSVPRGGERKGRSFPSGHTANHFAVAAVLALFYRRWGWLYGLVALTVGFSRIYVGVHWPSDVFASIFVGTGVGILGVAAAESLWRWVGLRWWPRLWERHPSLRGQGGAL